MPSGPPPRGRAASRVAATAWARRPARSTAPGPRVAARRPRRAARGPPTARALGPSTPAARRGPRWRPGRGHEACGHDLLGGRARRSSLGRSMRGGRCHQHRHAGIPSPCRRPRRSARKRSASSGVSRSTLLTTIAWWPMPHPAAQVGVVEDRVVVLLRVRDPHDRVHPLQHRVHSRRVPRLDRIEDRQVHDGHRGPPRSTAPARSRHPARPAGVRRPPRPGRDPRDGLRGGRAADAGRAHDSPAIAFRRLTCPRPCRPRAPARRGRRGTTLAPDGRLRAARAARSRPRVRPPRWPRPARRRPRQRDAHVPAPRAPSGIEGRDATPPGAPPQRASSAPSGTRPSNRARSSARSARGGRQPLAGRSIISWTAASPKGRSSASG